MPGVFAGLVSPHPGQAEPSDLLVRKQRLPAIGGRPLNPDFSQCIGQCLRARAELSCCLGRAHSLDKYKPGGGKRRCGLQMQPLCHFPELGRGKSAEV